MKGRLIGAFCLLSVLSALSHAPAYADSNYDMGLKFFQAKRYAEAAKEFEKSISNAPWESSSYYYCALAYHYGKDMKKAATMYGQVVEKFPGTAACSNAMAALKVVDPNFFKNQANEKAIAAATKAAASQATTASASSSGKQDKGTVEGEAQTRAYFTKSGDVNIIDVRVGGHAIRAQLDVHGEATAFSHSQLQSLGVQVPAGAKQVRCDVQIGGAIRKNFPVNVDDSVGAEPKVGASWLDAFIYQVDDKSSCLSLTRKGGTGAGGSSGPQVSFTKDGRDIVVSVEINGRSAQCIFEPNGEGITLSPRGAKAVGLRVDEAEENKPLASEGPQRGEPGWVPLEERAAGPKYLTVNRVKFGPCEKSQTQVQVSDKDSKYGKVGADICSGYKFDIDYQASCIRFTRGR